MRTFEKERCFDDTRGLTISKVLAISVTVALNRINLRFTNEENRKGHDVAVNRLETISLECKPDSIIKFLKSTSLFN